jgi:mRNA interferase HigB
MQLINVLTLDNFKRGHADARTPLDTWRVEVELASWKTSQDIKNHYRHADFLAKDRVMFNIKGNSYQFIVVVKYLMGMVFVEWVGTHAEHERT